MKIILSKKNISFIRKLRKNHPNNEIGVMLSKKELIWFVGKKDRIDFLPMSKGVPIHTHPRNKYKYDPPSKYDIEISLNYPKCDLVVFDRYGIWVYKPVPGIEKFLDFMMTVNNKECYLSDFIINKTDYEAIGIINEYITLEEYIHKMRTMVNINNKFYGIDIKFYPYYGIDDIELTYVKPK